MAQINLLPWREERRQELKRQFISISVGVSILSAICVYVIYGFFNSQIDNQKARNKFVQGKTAELEVKITEILELQERRDQIVESMKVIQELQGNRPVIVRAMSTISSTVPEGVYYTKIEKKGAIYKMYGVAETNTKISKLMRNLDDSDWFKEANLDKVTAIKSPDKSSEKFSEFELTVIEEIPKEENPSEDEAFREN